MKPEISGGRRKEELVRALVDAHKDGDEIAVETAYADARDSGVGDVEIAHMLLILDTKDGNGILLSPAISKTFEYIQAKVEKIVQ